MKHTKEPWKVIAPKHDEMFEMVGSGLSGIRVGYMNFSADAERIALCVNKCAGLTDEALEKDIIDWAVGRAVPVDGIRESTIWQGVKVWEE